MLYQEISEEEFDNKKIPALFADPQFDRRFAWVTKNNYDFKFGWRSDLIAPEVKQIKNNVFCIGVDQNFVVINFENGELPVNIELFYPFVSTLMVGGFIFVVTEMAVIKISEEDYQATEIALPDIFERLLLRNDRLSAICMDGHIISLN